MWNALGPARRGPRDQRQAGSPQRSQLRRHSPRLSCLDWPLPWTPPGAPSPAPDPEKAPAARGSPAVPLGVRGQSPSLAEDARKPFPLKGRGKARGTLNGVAYLSSAWVDHCGPCGQSLIRVGLDPDLDLDLNEEHFRLLLCSPWLSLSVPGLPTPRNEKMPHLS